LHLGFGQPTSFGRWHKPKLGSDGCGTSVTGEGGQPEPAEVIHGCLVGSMSFTAMELHYHFRKHMPDIGVGTVTNRSPIA
jgi:hypothetical protein